MNIARKNNSTPIPFPAAAVLLVFTTMLITSLVCVIRPPQQPDPTTMPVPRLELQVMQGGRVAFDMNVGSVILSLPEHGQLVVDGQVITQAMLPFTVGAAAPERLVGR
jgi:hypothetical protein